MWNLFNRKLKDKRYPMTNDQLAQIDCRMHLCKWNSGGGRCSNVSPALTLTKSLNGDNKFTCWSQKEK